MQKFESNFLKCHSLSWIHNIYPFALVPWKWWWNSGRPSGLQPHNSWAEEKKNEYECATCTHPQNLQRICKMELSVSQCLSDGEWSEKKKCAISIEMLISLDMHSKTSRFCLDSHILQLRGHNTLRSKSLHVFLFFALHTQLPTFSILLLHISIYSQLQLQVLLWIGDVFCNEYINFVFACLQRHGNNQQAKRL